MRPVSPPPSTPASGIWYDVTSGVYGATGDGVTDDTTAINAAITAAHAAGGGVVYLPEGTYVTAGVTLKSNVVLRGDGYSSTVKLKAATTSDVIKTNGTSGAPISFAGVEHLTVDGNKSGQSNGVDLQQYGVNLNSANDCWVDRVWVKNVQRSGMYLSGSRNSVTNCHLSDIGKVGAASSIIGRSGIVCDSDGTNTPKGTIIRNNRVLDCLEHGIKIYPGAHNSEISGNYVLAAEDRGIYVQGSNYCTVSGNRIDGASVVGIFVGDATDAGIGNAVTGNTVNGILVGTSGGHGILVQNQTGAQVTGNEVSGCNGNGIYVLGSSAYAVTGNRIHGNGSGGGGGAITCYQSPNGTVSGNVCANHGTTGSRGAGVWLWDGGTACLHVVLAGNRCFDTGAGAAKKQAYGVLSENLSNYVTLAGNDLADNFTATYSIVGANNSVLSAPHTTMTFGPFVLNDVPGTSTVPMGLGYFNTTSAVSVDTANLVRMPAAGRVVGLALSSDADRTAGAATAYVKVNGAAGASINGSAVSLDGTNVSFDSVLVPHDSGLAAAASDTLQIEVDTSGWTPTTANLLAWLTVSLD